MVHASTVQPGELHWIELDNIRFRVRVLRRSFEFVGWWLCATERTGDELVISETNFRQ